MVTILSFEVSSFDFKRHSHPKQMSINTNNNR